MPIPPSAEQVHQQAVDVLRARFARLLAPEARAPGYSAREIHFVWAHLEEYLELNLGTSGEAGRHVKDALRAEYLNLGEAEFLRSYRRDRYGDMAI